MPLTLRTLKMGKPSGESFPIPPEAGSYTIGRNAENDFAVEHSSISGVHARFEVSGENGIDLVDCDSRNGTFVNGERIERREVEPGDRIRIASLEFQLDDDSAGPAGEGDPVPVLENRIAELEGRIAELDEDLHRRDDAVREREQRNVSLLEEHGKEIGSKNREIDGLVAERDRLLDTVRERDGRISNLEGEIASRDETIREKESEIESLLRKHQGEIEAKDGEIAGITAERDRWHGAHEKKAADLERAREDLEERTRSEEASLRRLDQFLASLRELGERLRNDWSAWTPEEHRGPIDERDENAVLARVDEVRAVIRGQLDLIEPIWGEFGEGVQEELRGRCERLRGKITDLEEQRRVREEQFDETRQNLTELREELSGEVRRAQGLSRKGMYVEIPKRFENMVIAEEREQVFLRRLITQVEFFDRLLEGYRKSKKLREVTVELEDLRSRLGAILEDSGVEEFEIPVGTLLTPKHRHVVKVLSRKGWGTREHIEQPFRPGEVTKVVESGYHVGQGDDAAVLRKVAVLIREVDG